LKNEDEDQSDVESDISEVDLENMSDLADEDNTPSVLDAISGNHYRCAAHSLQLCLAHSIKATLATDKSFKKLLSLQKSFAHSSQARSALKNQGEKLVYVTTKITR
jgi:hypothetical protein